MKKKTARPEFWWSEAKQQWRKRFTGADGHQHEAWGDTKSSCRQRMEEMKREISLKAKPSGDLFVYQYARIWYELKAGSVKEATCERYRTNINKHICPVIGQLQMQDVTSDDILRVLAGCSGLKRGTQAKVLSTMRMIFAAAKKSGIVKENPCLDAKPGGEKGKSVEPLTKAQQKALLEAVTGTKAETFVKLCLFAGVRREEALGLLWDSVILSAEVPYIIIRRAVNWSAKGAPSLVEDLKSDAAKRQIPIPPQLAIHLKGIKKASGPVIANSSGGIMSKQSFRRMWEAVTVRAVHGKYRVGDQIRNHPITVTMDFKTKPHQLRHTYITELILSGANIKQVQYLAGHASVKITLEIYTHLMEHRPQDTAEAVMRAFEGMKNE